MPNERKFARGERTVTTKSATAAVRLVAEGWSEVRPAKRKPKRSAQSDESKSE